MKNFKLVICGLALIAFAFPSAVSAFECETFGPGDSGSDAGVIVCDGFTIVVSSFTDFGACSGAPNNCQGFYPN
jgi:hypothetical protein